MEQPGLDEHQRAFARYMAFWMMHFIEGLNDAHLLEKVKRHLEGSEPGERIQMRICIEKAIASAVEGYFNRIENQQIINEANKLLKRR